MAICLYGANFKWYHKITSKLTRFIVIKPDVGNIFGSSSSNNVWPRQFYYTVSVIHPECTLELTNNWIYFCLVYLFELTSKQIKYPLSFSVGANSLIWFGNSYLTGQVSLGSTPNYHLILIDCCLLVCTLVHLFFQRTEWIIYHFSLLSSFSLLVYESSINISV